VPLCEFDGRDLIDFDIFAQFKWLSHVETPSEGGEVANFERWLHQRDHPQHTHQIDGVVTFRDARMTQTPAGESKGFWASPPYDWIARTAPKGVIGFTFSSAFARSDSKPLYAAVVKVSLFDVAAGTVRLTQAFRADDDDGSVHELAGALPTNGDGKLKTLTFVVSSAFQVRSSLSTEPYDFEVRAADASGQEGTQPLVISMVRVIKTASAVPVVTKTVIEMTAAGDVSDYGDDVKADLASKFAELAGVDASKVEVIITSASVIITVKIEVASASAASTLTSTLATTLSDASAASLFTGLTVTSAPVLSVATETPAGYVPPDDSFWKWWVILAIAGGGALVLSLVALAALCYCCRAQEARRRATKPPPRHTPPQVV